MIPTRKEWMEALEERHGMALQQKFSGATVAVCGLGGLGSHIATTLARAGVGTLILIDYDRVDITNLHRQQYKADQIGKYKTDAMAEILKEIAPYTEVKLITGKITRNNCAAFLAGADVVCEAFDRAEEKAMLTDCVMELLSDSYLVAASGMAGIGTPNSIRTRSVAKRFYLCGDEESDVDDVGSLIAPRVMLCAAHQALTTLRILAGELV